MRQTPYGQVLCYVVCRKPLINVCFASQVMVMMVSTLALERLQLNQATRNTIHVAFNGYMILSFLFWNGLLLLGHALISLSLLYSHYLPQIISDYTFSLIKCIFNQTLFIKFLPKSADWPLLKHPNSFLIYFKT